MDRKLHVDPLILIPSVKNLHLLVLQTDEWMDRQMDRQTFIPNSYMHCLYILHKNHIQWCMENELIRCGLPSLRSSRYSCCAWAGGTFLHYLRKDPPAHSCSVCVLQELGWKYM
jgi:hypothetical protein